MFEKSYPVIFITFLPPFPLIKLRCTHKLSNHHYSSN